MAIQAMPKKMLRLVIQGCVRNRSDDTVETVVHGEPAAVVMSRRLEQDNPASFAIMKKFVAENQLRTRSGHIDNSSGAYPVLQQKLREYIKSQRGV